MSASRETERGATALTVEKMDELAAWCEDEADYEETYAAQERAKQFQGGFPAYALEYALQRAVNHDKRSATLLAIASVLRACADQPSVPVSSAPAGRTPE